jgi:hypothetical protein
MSSTNDSNDLEALFDSIAADFSPVIFSACSNVCTAARCTQEFIIVFI